MRKIDIEKINTLLLENNKKQLELSRAIGIKSSTLSSALNGKRPFPMSYVFEISDFFKIEPKDITICTNENITSIEDKNQLQEDNKK